MMAVLKRLRGRPMLANFGSNQFDKRRTSMSSMHEAFEWPALSIRSGNASWSSLRRFGHAYQPIHPCVVISRTGT